MPIPIDIEELRICMSAAVTEALLRFEHRRAQLGEKIFTEAAAAEVLGLTVRQLADERRRGRIPASKIVGGRIRYLWQDIYAYMLRSRLNDPPKPREGGTQDDCQQRPFRE
jgi:hypothetical protein